MIYTVEFTGVLPTFNQYSALERTNRLKAAEVKRQVQDGLLRQMTDAKSFNGHVYVGFVWIRPDMRYDKDNVAFAKKFILDALQEAHVIQNDTWRLCTPFDLGYKINKSNPRTIVYVSDRFEEIHEASNA